MIEKPKETPKKELECPKKYVYDTGIIFECKDNIRVEIIGEDVVDLLNELATKCSKLEKENEQLKSELQKIYEIATINKVRDIVDEVYDDLLYETSDESDYARKKVLKCLEMIDDYKDVIENV